MLDVKMILYFCRKEVVCKGFLVLIDGKKASEEFWNVLDETFCLIEVRKILFFLPSMYSVQNRCSSFYAELCVCL